MTSITSIVASEHVADLRRAADSRRLAIEPSPAGHASRTQTIALRVAAPDEGALVTRLAALDDAPALGGQVLLAVADGEPIAALSLDDGAWSPTRSSAPPTPSRCCGSVSSTSAVRLRGTAGVRSCTRVSRCADRMR